VESAVTHRQENRAPAGDTSPKGMVADHWTWRDGAAHVTGYHPKPKRGQQHAEPEFVTRRGVMFEASAPRPSRAKALKAAQGSLL
jgi:hypothetical protein